MRFFNKKIGPVFLKESCDTTDFINKMENLRQEADGELQSEIDKQIKLANYGLMGENNIIYELKNSGMDMYILHDIYLKFEDLSAQIDFVIVTRKRIYVIECKNLIGNIEIDNSGAFTRIYEYNGRKIKEGIYSPITQNERHLRVIKEVRKTSKDGVFAKKAFDKNFDDNYKSIVILANPKNYINTRYAKKEVREKVIRADQLIDFLKKSDAEFDGAQMSNDKMFEVANFFLEKNIEGHSDYIRKYQEMLDKAKETGTNAGCC